MHNWWQQLHPETQEIAIGALLFLVAFLVSLFLAVTLIPLVWL